MWGRRTACCRGVSFKTLGLVIIGRGHGRVEHKEQPTAATHWTCVHVSTRSRALWKAITGSGDEHLVTPRSMAPGVTFAGPYA